MQADTSSRAMPWWKEPTRDQWAALAAAWSGWVLDAFDFTIFLLVMPHIAKEFGVGITAVSASITLTLLVRLIGGVAAGWAADRWGRRLPLMIAMVWLAVFDSAIAFAPSLTWILVLRTLFGFGMGAEWAAGATLAMESWPARSKHIASGLLQAGWPVGYLLAAAVSAFVVPVWGWRALFLIAAAPALLVLPVRMFVKESPEWLAQKAARAAQGTGPRPVAAIARASMVAMRGKLIWGSVVMALGFGVYYAMGAQYPTMLMTEHGMGAGELGGVLIVFNLGMLVGAIACGALAERKGVLFTVAVPALLMVPLMPLYVGMAPQLLYVGAFVGGAVGLGFCGVVPSLLTGMFDTSVRARAVGFVYHAGAFLAAFVPIAVAGLADTTSLSLAESIALIGGGFEIALALVFVASRRTAAMAVAAPAGAH